MTSHDNVSQILTGTRERILRGTQVGMLLLAVPLVAVSLWRIESDGLKLAMLFHVLSLPLFVYLLLRANRHSYARRAHLTIGYFFLIGVVGFYDYGILGKDLIILLFFTPLLAVIYFDIRLALLYLVAGAILAITVAVAVFSGHHAIMIDADRYVMAPSSWASLILAAIGGAIVATIAFSHTHQTMADMIKRLEDKRLELERKNARLAAEESRLTQYMEVVESMVLALDVQGKVTLANRKCCEVLGLQEKDVIGRSWFDHFLAASDRRTVGEGFKQMIAGRHDQMDFFENMVLTASGEVRLVAWHNATLRDREGHVIGTLSSGQDITQQKAAELRRLELEAGLRQAQKMESVGRLAGGVAHDFNNILTVILGYTEVGGRQLQALPDPKLKNCCEEIQMAAARGRDIVKQLLAFSRNEALPADVIVAEAVVREAMQLLRTFPDRIDIRVEIADDVPPVFINPTALYQVLVNLGLNARDAMEGEGRLDVEVTRAGVGDRLTCDSCYQSFSGQHVSINLRDTGRGISSANLGKVFDPFFTTKKTGEGSGLGLSVVHGIVHDAGGHIRVDSQPEEGTAVWIYLPVFAPGNMA